MWSLLAKPPVPPTEAKSNQVPNSGLFESGGSRGYTAGGPLSEKWSEIFPQEQGRRGLRLDDKSWTSYLRWACIMFHALAMHSTSGASVQWNTQSNMFNTAALATR